MEESRSLNFIEEFIEEDIANGKHGGQGAHPLST